MRMSDASLKPSFSHLVSELRTRHSNLAYLHLVEPRITGGNTRTDDVSSSDSNNFLRDLWAPRPLISAGGFRPHEALEHADSTGDLIAFGRHYIAKVRLFVPLSHASVH